ncbi:MAG: Zn-dependent protease [Spirochaetes bacterium]|nr:Zn-dependent protease [Spirochaetota bacterium]
MRYALVLLTILCAAALPVCRGEQMPVIAVQPLGPVDRGTVELVMRGVREYYRLEAVLLPPIPLPPHAYYAHRNRYRAEKLLAHLDSLHGAAYRAVLGITASDISTTKGDIPDWGIFGLAILGGRACVVSTFRLRRGAGEAKINERLVKVANHELGHAFGLPHCPTPRCLMNDAKGTIATVDYSTGRLCDRCREKLLRSVAGGVR